ncbi:hypothetical protein B0A54_13804 [Friedmanniomyces endolithicus]|uniref:Uncharacterized protein n=1 Tax=Friedmanniomyces endolithicus TaxID=329885 RepID=A0A4U0UGC9_9PEZI|nr:hypothetical protein LTS09_012327 [Friedmanniomyces endolithicus]TKA34660.1 hypothetical protein B0A54_13804 [Friedmanniomyces endolithicus]
MSPVRRYLRITKYSVLEVRIYLEKPSDASWLLSSREPVLAQVIDAVRPLVLPKLREENEAAKQKSKDFEITIFLTELSTRHSLLTKQKQFSDKPKLKATSNKLTGWLNNNENPIHIEDDGKALDVLQEEDDVPELQDIPETEDTGKRKAPAADEEDPLFVSSDDEDFFLTQTQRPPKRRKRGKEPIQELAIPEPEEPAFDDKKKLAMNTSYDGFSIYGRILCLLVKRKGKKAVVGGSQMLEQWVSTQAVQEGGLNEDEDG